MTLMHSSPDHLPPAGWQDSIYEIPHYKTGRTVGIRYGHLQTQFKPAARALILPGFDRSFGAYFPLVHNLAKSGIQPIANDLFGQGGSCHERQKNGRRVQSDAPYSTHAEDIHHFVREIFPMDRTVPNILIAHSMRGNIALQYAKAHEERGDFPFDAIVLMAPMVGL